MNSAPHGSADTPDTSHEDQKTPPPELHLSISMQDSINASLWENSVPVLQALSLDNQTDRSFPRLDVTITSDPPLIRSHTWRLQDISPHQFRAIGGLELRLDGPALCRQTEASRAEITFTVTTPATDGKEPEQLHQQTTTVRVLARNEWGGLSGIPDILAAFVLPNDPAVARILRSASSILRDAGKTHSLEGYQGSKTRVWEQAQAIWCAICALDITYVNPPASFIESGQRVRLPTQIAEEKLATCLDSALLFASCLEAAGLHPVIVLTKGHAFTGLWLADTDAGSSVMQDLPAFRNRLKLDDLKVFETTLVTHARKPSFTAACDKGEATLRHAGEDEDNTFREIIDIHRARMRKIHPLSSGAGRENPDTGENDQPDATHQPVFEAAPGLREDTADPAEDLPDNPADRISRWCNRLLDMSARNRLLNLPKSEKQIIEIDCPDPAELENRLAEIRSGSKTKPLRFCAWPEMMKNGDPRDAALHHERHHDEAALTYARDALKRGELLVDRTEQALQAALTEIYRRAQAAEQEGGSNILFLTIGALAWTKKEGDKPWLAPLILVPVTLERPSVKSGFFLRAHSDDSRVNITLLEMLREDYALRFPELEGDTLPEDEAGLDVSRIVDIFRARIRQVPKWEVRDHVTLTTLSFAKFLMWKDLTERRDSLRANDVARKLLDGVTQETADTPPGTFFTEADGELDEALSKAGLVCPMEADSSQLRAVARAASGENFVLIGPPGTGKSQTITNIIANTLAQGRTVLFVAEKRAALEVVRKRLKDISLAEFCLDLFSPKASKTGVLEQFGNAQGVADSFDESFWQYSHTQIDQLRAELNAYVTELHKRWRNGWTPYRGIGISLRAFDARIMDLALSWSDPDTHSEDDYKNLRDAAEDLAQVHARIGDVASSPALAGLARTEWGPQWERDFLAAIRTLQACLDRLIPAAKDARKLLGLNPDLLALPDILRTSDLCSRILNPEACAWAFTEDASATRETLFAEQTPIARHRALTGELETTWKPEVTTLPLEDLLKTWREAKEKSVFQFLARSKAQKSVRASLAAHATGQIPEDCEAELERLAELQAIEKCLNDAPHARTVGPDLWRGLDTDFDQIEARHIWGKITRGTLAAAAPDVTALLAARTQLTTLLRDGRDLLQPGGAAHTTLKKFQTELQTVTDALSALSSLSGTDSEQLVSATAPDWPALLRARLESWNNAARDLRDWCNWKITCQKAERLGLAPLVDAIGNGLIPPEQTVSIFEANYARWWIAAAVEQSPLLRGFIAATHEKSIERFRDLDRQLMTMASRMIRARLAGKIPDARTRQTDPEYKVLTREIQKKTRHLPIRQLAEKMPGALRNLTPCLMMSPLSVAQYLPHNARPFDLVIFDEASQIPTWDAVGVIGRGSQVIVVGDPKQLPPTSFFSSNAGSDDENTDVDTCDLESILDECLGAGIPPVWLNWHYRSRHESLIAFSNHAYYHGQLVTFPSPATKDNAVSFRFVPDGVYMRGTGRNNPAEARAIVTEAVRLLQDGSNRTLGIVTFNAQQQTLISDLFDKARGDHPDIERFFSPETTSEPVLIRNLENVQGEERDVMLFSLTFGPDQAGHITMNFGALNRDGGERRLNVAITRAREKLIVFGSLRADQIDIRRTAAQGVHDLRDFLAFAEHGPTALAGAHHGSIGDFDSLFEEEVAALLRRKGWQVVPQVGVSGFRIDLGIVDPDRPAIFLAGVECDGATYHRSATARDRDRLRHAVLENLGWSICRIWSTDWWTNAPRECDRIDATLRALLETKRKDRAAQEEKDRQAAETASRHKQNSDRAAAKAPDNTPSDHPTTAGQGTAASRTTSPVTSPATSASTAPETNSDTIPSDHPTITTEQGTDTSPTASRTTSPVTSPVTSSVTPPAISPGAVPETETRTESATVPAADSAPAPGTPALKTTPEPVSSPNPEPLFAKTTSPDAPVTTALPTPDQSRFFDAGYQPTLSALITHYLEQNGPIRQDLLVQAISRLHNFGRAGREIREHITGSIPPDLRRTDEDPGPFLWPASMSPETGMAFPAPAKGETLDPATIPLAALTSRARTHLSAGLTPEATILALRTDCGMSRMGSTTRARLEQAVSQLLEENPAP
ncbi:DUF3320 domain-containing protein [Acetobacter musti]|uniref:DUF3320 domain-containing protein n=1 Tax=Acetobacter musti TaxID=864732 RepID=A0ABX0JTT5_9PROT|nr:DUF3320 domain-containing protein [Acetobacter musti]NHN85945.1 DUF3320 domain-containing protein [Acetobacter musti]